MPEIGVTHFCKTPDCDRESRSAVGRYSYCDECRAIRERNSSKPLSVGVKAGSLEQRVKQLTRQAKNADKLAAHAKTLTERALEAKANADKAADEARRLAREIFGD